MYGFRVRVYRINVRLHGFGGLCMSLLRVYRFGGSSAQDVWGLKYGKHRE